MMGDVGIVCLPLDEVCHNGGGRYVPFQNHVGDGGLSGCLVLANWALAWR